MNIEQICIASFKSMFDERIEDDVNLTPKYIEMLVREHCEPYMIVTQGFTHDLLANALDYMDWFKIWKEYVDATRRNGS